MRASAPSSRRAASKAAACGPAKISAAIQRPGSTLGFGAGVADGADGLDQRAEVGLGRFIPRPASGQGAIITLSPTCGSSCQSASVTNGMNGCSRRTRSLQGVGERLGDRCLLRRRCRAAGPWPPRCTSRTAPTRRTRGSPCRPRRTGGSASGGSPRRWSASRRLRIQRSARARSPLGRAGPSSPIAISASPIGRSAKRVAFQSLLAKLRASSTFWMSSLQVVARRALGDEREASASAPYSAVTSVGIDARCPWSCSSWRLRRRARCRAGRRCGRAARP